MGSEGVSLISGRNRRPDCNPIDSEPFHQWREFQIHGARNTAVVFKPSDRRSSVRERSREEPGDNETCGPSATGVSGILGTTLDSQGEDKSTEPALILDSHIHAKSREWTSIREDPDFVRRPSMGLRWATLKLQ